MSITTFFPAVRPANKDNFFLSASLLQVLSLLVMATMMFSVLSPVLETMADDTSGGATVAVGVTVVTVGVVAAAAAAPAIGTGLIIVAIGCGIIGAGIKLWGHDPSSS